MNASAATAPPPPPLRIGLIGAGENTRLKHIPGFQALPNVQLAAVVNRTPASTQRVARQYNIPREAADWRDIVNAPDIDAICIGTWPYLHAEVTIAALQAGKHVLTEARMARDAREAAAMHAAANEARRAHTRLVAQIVPAPLTLAYDATLRRLIQTGALGTLRELHITQTHAAQADPDAPFTWRQSLEWSGHNIMTLGIHYEALLRWLDDDAEVQAATGTIHTPARRDAQGELHPVHIPETLTVLARYPKTGTRLTIHLSGVDTTPPRNEIRIIGSQAGLHLDLLRDELWLTPRPATPGAPPPPPQRIEPRPDERGTWRVEADFVASIREAAPVRLTDFATGVRYMRFTDAVWQALASTS